MIEEAPLPSVALAPVFDAANTCSSPAAVIIEKRVTRYSCPHCGRSRSKRKAVADHMFSCWKNPAAKSCGSCEHHLPPEKGESACWLSGYPGSPGHPRSCDVGIDNAEAMPRQCVRWAAEGTDAHLHQPTGAEPVAAATPKGEPEQKDQS